MAQMPIETIYLLGAGFSSYAGIPLQKDFAKDILRGGTFGDDQPSRIIVDALETFVTKVFHRSSGREDTWPDWEDLFTCVDLSANTGHHLGPRYDPRRLRTIRRAILSRIIRMLEQRYKKALNDVSKGELLQLLDQFLAAIDLSTSAFVSLNWDTVLELRLMKQHTNLQFDYGPHVTPARFVSNRDSRITVDGRDPSRRRVNIAKIHGAINWLYCDNCRCQFSFPANRTGSVATQLMQKRDWLTLRPKAKKHPKSGRWRCSICGVFLGTRIATFSYRKVLDSPILSKTWFHAEDLLRRADNWVFVGYSLPDADFEFKYMLKRIEVSRPSPPRLFLLDPSKDTVAKYRNFFGTALPANAIHIGGLGPQAVDHLRRQGIRMARGKK